MQTKIDKNKLFVVKAQLTSQVEADIFHVVSRLRPLEAASSHVAVRCQLVCVGKRGLVGIFLQRLLVLASVVPTLCTNAGHRRDVEVPGQDAVVFLPQIATYLSLLFPSLALTRRMNQQGCQFLVFKLGILESTKANGKRELNKRKKQKGTCKNCTTVNTLRSFCSFFFGEGKK